MCVVGGMRDVNLSPWIFIDEGGVRLKELINWYLKEVEGEIDTVQELTDKKLLVEKVIDRLVNHVSQSKSPRNISAPMRP